MSKTDVKLLGAWPSPYVNRVQVALTLKSVEYDFLEHRFGPENELLIKSNPVHKKIPVLIHGNNPICESHIIAQYIDETWTTAPTLLPSDPYDRAIARFWATYVDEKEYKICATKITGSTSGVVRETPTLLDWYIDTGAARHICANKKNFFDYTVIEDGMSVCMGNFTTEKVVGRGTIVLLTESGWILTLKDVFHVPSIRVNLISGSCLCEDGYKLEFALNKFVLIKDNWIWCDGYLCNGLFKANTMTISTEDPSEVIINQVV